MTSFTSADALPTRASLLSRLRDPGADQCWQDFFRRYRDLIWRLARKSGLTDSESDEVLQETMLSLVRQLPEFRYDPTRGSFKGWLSTIVRRRVVDQFRRRRVQEVAQSELGEDFEVDRTHDAAWDAEWEKHLLAQAMERTRAAVSAQQFQLFDLFALQGMSMSDVKRLLNVNAPQVYMAKMRVGLVFRRELATARRENECPRIPQE